MRARSPPATLVAVTHVMTSRHIKLIKEETIGIQRQTERQTSLVSTNCAKLFKCEMLELEPNCGVNKMDSTNRKWYLPNSLSSRLIHAHSQRHSQLFLPVLERNAAMYVARSRFVWKTPILNTKSTSSMDSLKKYKKNPMGR